MLLLVLGISRILILITKSNFNDFFLLFKQLFRYYYEKKNSEKRNTNSQNVPKRLLTLEKTLIKISSHGAFGRPNYNHPEKFDYVKKCSQVSINEVPITFGEIVSDKSCL